MKNVLEKPVEPILVEAFLEWAEQQPEGRFELVRGKIVAMAPERARHSLTKHEVAQKLKEAVRKSGLDCTVFPDGMTVVVDKQTCYEPDAVVQCGGSIDLDSVMVDTPIIVVEVLSPSTGHVDISGKLVDYFRVLCIVHYLIVDTQRHALIHHQREAGEGITTRILKDGLIRLEPPGVALNVGDLFIEEPAGERET